MKKQHARMLRYLVALIVLVSFEWGKMPAGDPDNKDAPKPLPTEIAKAWRDAGAEIGWMKDEPPQSDVFYEFWQPWRKRGEAGAIPAFRFPRGDVADNFLEKLPNPGTAFGLDFHCGFYAGVTLKDLANVKHLQSLCIGGVQGQDYADLKDLAGMKSLRGLYLFYLPVTNAQLKHLTGLRELQVLDLSSTRVTDLGMKELAGMKNLKWLNLRGTKVTPAEIASLQKELPKCKIQSGDD